MKSLRFKTWFTYGIFVATVFTGLPGFAAGGNGGGGAGDGGGGDPCENRIQNIRDDISDWISKEGPVKGNLKLPQGLDYLQYTTQMKAFLSVSQLANHTRLAATDIECVHKPVEVQNEQKICRFDLNSNSRPKVTCYYEAFMDSSITNEDQQYQLIHHEFAGLAKLESPQGPQSTYTISNQLSAYLREKLVKQLVVGRALNSALLPKEIRNEEINVNAYLSVEKEFATYKRILARAGRTVTNVKLGARNGYGHLFDIKFSHTATRNLNCAIDTQEIEAGIFGNVENELNKNLELLQISDQQLVDVEITSTYGTGSMGGIRVYFCKLN